MPAFLLFLSMITYTPATKLSAPTDKRESFSSQPSAEVRAAQTTHNVIFAGYVIVLLLSAVGTYLVWTSGNKVQDAIQAEANARIAEATGTASQADLRSKTLEQANIALGAQMNDQAGTVAILQKSAADAVRAQKQVELTLSIQQEKTAAAELALMALQKQSAQRGLTRNELIAVSLSTGPLGGQAIDIIYPKDDSECRLLASNLIIAFPEPTWRPTLFEGPGWWMHQVDVEYDPSDKEAEQRAEAVFIALRATNKLNMGGPFGSLPQDLAGTPSNYYSTPPKATIRITIGYR